MNRPILDNTVLEPFVGRTWALDSSTTEDLYVVKLVYLQQGDVVYLPTNFLKVPIYVKFVGLWDIIRVQNGSITIGNTVTATKHTALGFEPFQKSH